MKRVLTSVVLIVLLALATGFTTANSDDAEVSNLYNYQEKLIKEHSRMLEEHYKEGGIDIHSPSITRIVTYNKLDDLDTIKLSLTEPVLIHVEVILETSNVSPMSLGTVTATESRTFEYNGAKVIVSGQIQADKDYYHVPGADYFRMKYVKCWWSRQNGFYANGYVSRMYRKAVQKGDPKPPATAWTAVNNAATYNYTYQHNGASQTYQPGVTQFNLVTAMNGACASYHEFTIVFYNATNTIYRYHNFTIGWLGSWL